MTCGTSDTHRADPKTNDGAVAMGAMLAVDIQKSSYDRVAQLSGIFWDGDRQCG